MNKEKFWSMIDDARNSGGGWQGMIDPLCAALAELPPMEIVHWQGIFDEYHYRANKGQVVSAAVYINGGISDDGFIDFRSWLVAQGKDIYMKTLAEPDSLADTKAIRAFAAEANASNYVPERGYQNKPQFEAINYASIIAFEQKFGMESDFYNLLDANPISDLEMEIIAKEIKYAKKIDVMPNPDTPLLEAFAELEKRFPKLTAVLDPDSAERKPSVISKIKEKQKATEKPSKSKAPKKTSKRTNEKEM